MRSRSSPPPGVLPHSGTPYAPVVEPPNAGRDAVEGVGRGAEWDVCDNFVYGRVTAAKFGYRGIDGSFRQNLELPHIKQKKTPSKILWGVRWGGDKTSYIHGCSSPGYI